MNNILNNQLNNRTIVKLKKQLDVQSNLIHKKINVVRTLPFEYIEKVYNSFYEFTNLKFSSNYSDYDVSLPNISFEGTHDIFIFWMDWRLYMKKMEPKALLEWVKSRLAEIDENKPILMNNWPTFWELDERQYAANVSKRSWIYEFNYLLEDLKKDMINVEIIDLNLFASQLGMSSYDARNDEISHYPLSNQLTLQIARHIALQLIPAMLEPKLKAIVLDLDNTLYSGVLGEDGLEGIVVTEEHIQLQKVLKNMKDKGTLLAISSKNDERDVMDLLENHPKFILKKDDFTFVEANWNSKEINILSMAEKFNFDVSAMLFVDDNLAEIARVKEEIPTIYVLLADPTGQETVHRLLNYPYLYSRKKDDSAVFRQQDILSNQKRMKLAKLSSDPSRYLKSLNMKIEVFENEQQHTQRVFEMGQKTNQFNLALQRFSSGDLFKKAQANNYCIFTVTLADILNDSGIIGSYIVQIDGVKAYMEEILFSCRALGRKVEDASLLLILERLQLRGIEKVKINVTEGPRNKPAINWYKEVYTSSNIVDIIKELKQKLAHYPAEVIWSNERRDNK